LEETWLLHLPQNEKQKYRDIIETRENIRHQMLNLWKTTRVGYRWCLSFARP